MTLASILFIAAAAAAPLDASTSTCAQITARIEQLRVQTEREDAVAARRASQGRLARGLLGGLASGALGAAGAELAGRSGGLGALAAQQVLSSASASAAQALTEQATAAAEPPPTISSTQTELKQLLAQSAARGC